MGISVRSLDNRTARLKQKEQRSQNAMAVEQTKQPPSNPEPDAMTALKAQVEQQVKELQTIIFIL